MMDKTRDHIKHEIEHVEILVNDMLIEALQGDNETMLTHMANDIIERLRALKGWCGE